MGDLKKSREFEDDGLHKTTSKGESRYNNHNVMDNTTDEIHFRVKQPTQEELQQERRRH